MTTPLSRFCPAMLTGLLLGLGSLAHAQTTNAVVVDTTDARDSVTVRVGRVGAEIVRYRENGDEVVVIRRRAGGRMSNRATVIDTTDDEPEFRTGPWEWHRRRRHRDRTPEKPRPLAANPGGYFGFEGAFMPIQTEAFNPLLPADLALPEQQFLPGFSGYLQGYHWRVGLAGFGGTKTRESVANDTARSVSIRQEAGQVTLDYVIGFKRRVELGAGVMVGGGTVRLGLNRQVGADPSFEDIVGGLTNPMDRRYTNTLEASYFTFGPRATARVRVFDWLSVMGTGLYPFGRSDKWQQNRDLFDEDGLNVVGGPEIKAQGPVFQLGVFIGS